MAVLGKLFSRKRVTHCQKEQKLQILFLLFFSSLVKGI